MKRKNVFAAFGLLAIVAIMSVVTLSSFSGKAEAKTPAAKAVEAKVFTPVLKFYDAGDWLTTNPNNNCGGESIICSGSFDRPAGATLSDDDILEAARLKYIADGHLANTSVQSFVVTVAASTGANPIMVDVTITERSSS